jgi:hypothetical protein
MQLDAPIGFGDELDAKPDLSESDHADIELVQGLGGDKRQQPSVQLLADVVPTERSCRVTTASELDITHGRAIAGNIEINLAVRGGLHGGDKSRAAGRGGSLAGFRENSIESLADERIQGKAPGVSGSHEAGFILRL